MLAEPQLGKELQRTMEQFIGCDAHKKFSQRRMSQRWSQRHVAQLYERVKHSSHMHGKAAVAVARHLAEASYWILSKQEVYQEPRRQRPALSSTHG
jgi:hypothetical protein